MKQFVLTCFFMVRRRILIKLILNIIIIKCIQLAQTDLLEKLRGGGYIFQIQRFKVLHLTPCINISFTYK